ncbi:MULTISPECIES: response regulator transcription factor [unclassified Paenibacillus]|uniref:response regulator transcription factor n=1 Tax=unclassified Paenibacillus TaxID=185978 RepID=UPI001AE3EA95|nr:MULTISPECIES: response regulator transcription factor [unclassified Paenibacillus]MBP1154235.1 DNA-binding NarL/FixJ family response regulator [Paenibacillus sp. PvP091]MBP1170380.1 DNA-binding NarL/FixJ family response regulator [Paenibacillus sp. PvR098]MBP2441408.1 DNA-binding NarL/FixJ family response regulator [Paenibacillus sp. PvP052]
MPNKAKILLAEDQQLMLDSVQQLLKANPRYTILAAVANGRQALQYLETHTERPDLCLLDIQMPELDGIDCARFIRERYPSVKIALLTSFNSESYMEQGLISGVNGYILKDTNNEAFDRSIQSMLDGQFIAPAALMNFLSGRLKMLTEMEQKSSIRYTTELLSRSLDEKDIEIVWFIWRGWTNRMIADELYISEGTAKNYISRIYRKLQINNRSELMQLLRNLSQ